MAHRRQYGPVTRGRNKQHLTQLGTMHALRESVHHHHLKPQRPAHGLGLRPTLRIRPPVPVYRHRPAKPLLHLPAQRGQRLRHHLRGRWHGEGCILGGRRVEVAVYGRRRRCRFISSRPYIVGTGLPYMAFATSRSSFLISAVVIVFLLALLILLIGLDILLVLFCIEIDKSVENPSGQACPVITLDEFFPERGQLIPYRCGYDFLRFILYRFSRCSHLWRRSGDRFNKLDQRMHILGADSVMQITDLRAVSTPSNFICSV